MGRRVTGLLLGSEGVFALDSDAATAEQWAVLHHFLYAVEKVRPEVVSSLRDDFLPGMVAIAAPPAGEDESPRDAYETWERYLRFSQDLSTQERLRELLRPWRERFHLVDSGDSHRRLTSASPPSLLDSIAGFVLTCWYCLGDLKSKAVAPVRDHGTGFSAVPTFGKLVRLSRESKAAASWKALLSKTTGGEPRAWTEHQLASLRPVLSLDTPPFPLPPRHQVRFEAARAWWKVAEAPPIYYGVTSRDEWDRLAGEYAERVETAARAAGLSRTVQKLRTEHYEWTAKYQVGEESIDDLDCVSSIPGDQDNRYNRAKAAARKAINRTLNVVGVLPRVRPGQYPRA
jgi:hypothetical protein